LNKLGAEIKTIAQFIGDIKTIVAFIAIIAIYGVFIAFRFAPYAHEISDTARTLTADSALNMAIENRDMIDDLKVKLDTIDIKQDDQLNGSALIAIQTSDLSAEEKDRLKNALVVKTMTPADVIKYVMTR
jgi:spore coat protein CotH